MTNGLFLGEYTAPITFCQITTALLSNTETLSLTDLEHAYQYAKAIEFNDIDSSEAILCARTPSTAKLIGSKVKNFNTNEWNKVKENIMTHLLKIKFAPGTDMANKLLATAGKSLAEAGQSPPTPLECR